MAKWIPDSYLDTLLGNIVASDQECVCSQQPLTFYNAVWPDLWVQETVYAQGDLCYPPTQNNFIYECITAGTSGVSEPGWTTTQDSTFTDGTVTWKAHENYSLANTAVSESNFTISDGAVDGRKLTVTQIMGVVTHAAGTVTHTAFVNTETKELTLVTTAETTLDGGNDVDAGKSTIFFGFSITIRDPQ